MRQAEAPPPRYLGCSVVRVPLICTWEGREAAGNVDRSLKVVPSPDMPGFSGGGVRTEGEDSRVKSRPHGA